MRTPPAAVNLDTGRSRPAGDFVVEVPDDLNRILADAVAAFDRHMDERNRLQRDTIRQNDEFLVLERERLTQTREQLRRAERETELREEESRRYLASLAEYDTSNAQYQEKLT